MSRGETREIFRLLGIVAPAHDGIVHDRVLNIDNHAGGGIDCGDLFNRKHALEEVTALSAVFFGNLDAHQTQLEEFLQQAAC